jgi:hypothetical protein
MESCQPIEGLRGKDDTSYMKWRMLCVWVYFSVCALSKLAFRPDQRVTHTPLVIAMTLSALLINATRLDVWLSHLAFPQWLVQPYIPVSWQSVPNLSHVWRTLFQDITVRNVTNGGLSDYSLYSLRDHAFSFRNLRQSRCDACLMSCPICLLYISLLYMD